MEAARREGEELYKWMQEAVEAGVSGVRHVELDSGEMIADARREGEKRAWSDANNPRPGDSAPTT